jgi:hypothetical protein
VPGPTGTWTLDGVHTEHPAGFAMSGDGKTFVDSDYMGPRSPRGPTAGPPRPAGSFSDASRRSAVGQPCRSGWP